VLTEWHVICYLRVIFVLSSCYRRVIFVLSSCLSFCVTWASKLPEFRKARKSARRSRNLGETTAEGVRSVGRRAGEPGTDGQQQ
jgi:hypothetical protein